MDSYEAWKRRFTDYERQIQMEDANYKQIILELDQILANREVLPGDMSEKLAVLRLRTREEQNRLRDSLYQDIHRIYYDRKHSLNKVIEVLEQAVDPRLRLEDSDIDSEVDAWYASLSTNRWDDPKVERWLIWYEYYIDHVVPGLSPEDALEWLRIALLEIEGVLGNYSGEIHFSNLQQIKKTIFENRRELNQILERKDTRATHKDYVVVIKDLQQRYDASSDQMISEDLQKILFEYAEYCTSEAKSRFTQATKIDLPQNWSPDSPYFNPDMGLMAIETQLKLGLANLRPSLLNDPEYASISLLGDRTLSPDQSYLMYGAASKENIHLFLTLRDEKLPAALKALKELMAIEENNNQDLALLYTIYAQWPSEKISGRLNQERNKERRKLDVMLNQLASHKIYDLVMLTKLDEFANTLSISPMNLANALPDDRAYIADLEVILDDYRYRISEYDVRRQTLNSLLKTIDKKIENDSTDSTLEGDFNEIDRLFPYIDGIKELEDVLSFRVDEFRKKFYQHQNNQKQLTIIKTLHENANKAPDYSDGWGRIITQSIGIFDTDQADGTVFWREGRLLWLHAKTWHKYLEGKNTPIVSGSSRRTLLNEAHMMLKELENAVSIREADLRHINFNLTHLSELIEETLEETNEYTERNRRDELVADEVKSYYEGLKFIGKDYYTAYQRLMEENVSIGVINHLILVWKADVEDHMRWLQTQNTVDTHFINVIEKNINYLRSIDHPVAVDLENLFKRDISGKRLEALRQEHCHTIQRKRFGLVFDADTYKQWLDILHLQRNSSIIEKQIVCAYTIISEHFEVSIELIKAITSLEREIDKDQENVSQFILLDSLLEARTKLLYTQYKDSVEQDIDVALRHIADLKNKLVSNVKTKLDTDLTVIWNSRLATLRAFVAGNMSQTVEEIDELLAWLNDKNNQSEPEDTETGWLHYRQQDTRTFVDEITQSATASMHNELFNARKVIGVKPDQMARWLEYAFVIKKIAPEHSNLADNVVNGILPKLDNVLKHLINNSQRIITDDLPASIVIAYEKMGAQVTRVKSIFDGLAGLQNNNPVTLNVVPSLENLLKENEQQLASLKGAQEAYQEARDALLNMLLNKPSFTNMQGWNFSRYSQAYDAANNACHILQNGAGVDQSNIDQLLQLQILSESLDEQFTIILSVKRRIEMEISINANLTESPLERYKRLIEDDIPKLKRAEASIQQLLNESIENGALSSAGEARFSIPSRFLNIRLGVIQSRLSSSQDPSLERVIHKGAIESIYEYEYVINYLYNSTNTWVIWIDDLVKYRDFIENNTPELEYWHRYTLETTQIIFDNPSPSFFAKSIEDRKQKLLSGIYNLLNNSLHFSQNLAFEKLEPTLDQYKQSIEQMNLTIQNPPDRNPPADIQPYFQMKLGFDEFDYFKEDIEGRDLKRLESLYQPLKDHIKSYQTYISWIDQTIKETNDQKLDIGRERRWFGSGDHTRRIAQKQQEIDELEQAKNILLGKTR